LNSSGDEKRCVLDGVPRMLRNAPRLRRGALLIRSPHTLAVGPGAAEQRFTLHRVRDTKAIAKKRSLGSDPKFGKKRSLGSDPKFGTWEP
jgi:hypothetical protein